MKEIAVKANRLKALRQSLIAEAEEEVKRIKAKAEGQTINYSKVGTSGSNNNSAEAKTIRYIDAVAEVNSLTAEQDRLEAELSLLINRKFPGDKNSDRRRIYKFYYIDGLEAKDIAKEMHLAVGTVRNYLFCKN